MWQDAAAAAAAAAGGRNDRVAGMEQFEINAELASSTDCFVICNGFVVSFLFASDWSLRILVLLACYNKEQASIVTD